MHIAPRPADLPEIIVSVDLEDMTNEAIAALAKDSRVYQRSGSLVGVVTVHNGPTKRPQKIRRADGAVVIRALAPPTVRERMAASATWLKYDGRKKDHVRVLPPEAVVGTVCARGEWGGVRPLVAVATAPCLKPDGTVMQTPGYDADTATLYWPSDSYVAVSENPSRDDAKGALEAIREIVCDFPFAKPEHESAWIAGLLTMFARPAIDGPCPLFAVDATTRGTGKSRLVDAAVRLCTGIDAPRTSLPDDDDEMRKRISALMLEGDPAVCLDNITRKIALPSLDAVLTGTTWKDRLLGSTATFSAPARAVWWATGNNVELGGDLGRRTLHIRLESPLENPEERTGFKHPDLLRWVSDNRTRLVASALTILRAYTLSGDRYEGRLWGSFEEWSQLVPAALVWCGAPDPLEARASAEATMDDEKRTLTVLIDGLARLSKDSGPITARTMLEALYPDRSAYDEPAPKDGYDELRDAIEQETRSQPGRRPEARRLGKWLQRVRGRVVQGRRVMRDASNDHSATWYVEGTRGGESGSPGSATPQ